MSATSDPLERREARLAYALVLPALAAVALIAVFPLLWTVWESLHLHDLRMPWLGRPYVGAANYAEALSSARFWGALGHTAAFTAVTVTIELTAGLFLALIVNRVARGRDLVRTAVLLPWAIPTVVVALVWRFLFESPAGWTISVVTPSTVFILRAMCSSHPVQRFHSASWSRLTHASTAASMPIASSLPTL